MNLVKDFYNLESSDGFRLMIKSFERNRFPQSCIIVSQSKNMLKECVKVFAQKFLCAENFESSLNFFKISPTGPMRKIIVDDVRFLIKNIQSTPLVGSQKFVVIEEADCLNKEASNAILKAIEEPPADTIIFLTTTKYYNVLATLRSRCFIFRLNFCEDDIQIKKLDQWFCDFNIFLHNVFLNNENGLTCLILEANKLIFMLSEIVSYELKSVEDSIAKRELQLFLLKKLGNTISDFFLNTNKENLNLDFIEAMNAIEQSSMFFEFNIPFINILEKIFLQIVSQRF